MKLSVIIPLYNCERFIERCLDSVLSQRLNGDELEVIVIDDGSSDSSGRIADDYARRHDAVKVYHQFNSGVSAARNRGLEVATGDYIHFLDCDDFLLFNDSYQYLLDVIRQSDITIDVLLFSIKRADSSKGDEQTDLYNFRDARIYIHGTGREACKKSRFDGYIGSAFFNARLIREHLILFNPDILWAEDVDFNLKVYLHAKYVVSTDANIYGYYCNPDSITLNYNRVKLKRLLDNIIEQTPKLRQLLDSYNLPKFTNERLLSRAHVAATRLLSLNSSYPSTKEYIRRGKECGLFPLSDFGSLGKFYRYLDYLMKHPIGLWLMSFPYRYIFNPIIKPILLKRR